MNRGMLFVSFGTSHEETRIKTIDAIEAKVRATFPDCAAYSAWTSNMLIRKVAERGEQHDTLEQALERMTADGVDDLIVSTTCLLRGHEMAKIEKAVNDWSKEHSVPSLIADPLLASSSDCTTVAKILCDEYSFIPDDAALLLMGHGSSNNSNDTYVQIQNEMHAQGKHRFFVATLEGALTFNEVCEHIQASGASKVYLAPLMIVAGDHAKRDLAGTDEFSWASRLSASGYEVEPVLKGLGEFEGIQQLVCDHVDTTLLVREVLLRG